MSGSRDHLEMIAKSIEGFLSGGSLNAAELGEIIDIAERDGQVDQNEIRVLRSIVAKIKPEEVDAELREQLARISRRIGGVGKD